MSFIEGLVALARFVLGVLALIAWAVRLLELAARYPFGSCLTIIFVGVTAAVFLIGDALGVDVWPIFLVLGLGMLAFTLAAYWAHRQGRGPETSTITMAADLEADWEEVRAATPAGWTVGQPSYDAERRLWRMSAFDLSGDVEAGAREPVVTAVALMDRDLLKEMARCLHAHARSRIALELDPGLVREEAPGAAPERREGDPG